MDRSREKLVRSKRFLLSKSMAIEAGIFDESFMDILVNGVKLTGRGPTSCMFEESTSPPLTKFS